MLKSRFYDAFNTVSRVKYSSVSGTSGLLKRVGSCSVQNTTAYSKTAH